MEDIKLTCACGKCEQKTLRRILDRIEGALLFPFEGTLVEGKEIERPKIMDMQREAFNKITQEELQ